MRHLESAALRREADLSRDEGREFFPARTSPRITAVLALCFMAPATMNRTLANQRPIAFLWFAAVLNVPMAFHPRIFERAREMYATGI